MKRIALDHPSSEASALLSLRNQIVRKAFDWNLAFWTISDEGEASDGIWALGRNREDGWKIVPLKIELPPGRRRRTEDCETISRSGSWVYVFGSHFGGKQGPLEPRRHFALRFNEALVTTDGEGLTVTGEVARRPFLLHRLINDAIVESGLDVLPNGTELQQQMIQRTLERGVSKKKSWRKFVASGDVPINIEGATFLHGGRLLIGLRYPVTRQGHPIMVELEGIDRLFDDVASPPYIAGFRIVTSIGSPGEPTGIRELDAAPTALHLITGNLASDSKESVIVTDHPQGGAAPNEHWSLPLDELGGPIMETTARRVRRFEDKSVEGLAIEGNEAWYVIDDDRIVLESAALE